MRQGDGPSRWRLSMAPSWWQILIVLVLFVLLFGRGKISDLMGDVAKGIKSFKTGMADDGPGEPEPEPEPKVIEHERPAPQARKVADPRQGAAQAEIGLGAGRSARYPGQLRGVLVLERLNQAHARHRMVGTFGGRRGGDRRGGSEGPAQADAQLRLLCRQAPAHGVRLPAPIRRGHGRERGRRGPQEYRGRSARAWAGRSTCRRPSTSR